MSEESSPRRKPRADAERNRAHLLAVAKRAFAEKGAAASLEEIARTAGVGIGTLYRHFPTRDALIEEVYRTESRQLAATAKHLADTQPPIAALRTWLLAFVDHMATKFGMAEALASLVGGTDALYSEAGDQTRRVIAALVARGVASGDITSDIDPFDLLRALAGIAYVSPDPNWRISAERMVDLIIAGLQARAPRRD